MRAFLAVFFTSVFLITYGQDELLAELDAESGPNYTLSTFKGTRLVNGHSVETRPAGTLEFIISHRFGLLTSGSHELWGFDVSTIRIGLEYGITDRLSLGIGRSSIDKTFDSYVKYKFLRQVDQGFPFTVTGFGSIAYNSGMAKDSPELSTSDVMSQAIQLLIAHKFSAGFSLQLSPIMVNRNTVDPNTEVNTLFALGVGGRANITRSVSLNVEYYPRLNEKAETTRYDAVGVGVEIETGGHVFQLIFTNALGMMERRIVAQTPDDFFDGDIRFGFNITRTFQLDRKK